MRAEGFYCSLDVLYEGLVISKLQFFNQKKEKNLQLYFILNFWSSKPWIRIFHLKCWIRIRIHNAGGRKRQQRTKSQSPRGPQQKRGIGRQEEGRRGGEPKIQ
jgi:hypothetical protein